MAASIGCFVEKILIVGGSCRRRHGVRFGVALLNKRQETRFVATGSFAALLALARPQNYERNNVQMKKVKLAGVCATEELVQWDVCRN